MKYLIILFAAVSLSYGDYKSEILEKTQNLPVSVNISEGSYTDKMIFLFASLNSNLEFETNANQTLTEYLNDMGYLVISVSPRIDGVTEVKKRVRKWGIDRYVKDLHRVVKKVRRIVDLDYDVGGFSYGAFVALAYSAEHSHCRYIKTHILGLDSPMDSIFSQDSYDRAVLKIDSGIYVNYDGAELKGFIEYVNAFPNDPSQVPGFTNEQLLNYVLTNPDGVDLALLQNAAGDYTGLTHFTLETIVDGAAKIGSGLTTQALIRDFYASQLTDDIDFESITSKVIYVNGELGYGDLTSWCDLIDDCNYYVVPGYGHLDLIFGENANVDVWSLF